MFSRYDPLVEIEEDKERLSKVCSLLQTKVGPNEIYSLWGQIGNFNETIVSYDL